MSKQKNKANDEKTYSQQKSALNISRRITTRVRWLQQNFEKKLAKIYESRQFFK